MPAVLHAAVTLVALALAGDDLAVLLRTPRAERWELPTGSLDAGAALEAAAGRVAREALDAAPPSLRQVGAFDGEGDAIAVAWLALVPPAQAIRIAGDCAWHPLGALPVLAPSERAMLAAAQGQLRERVDREPVVFALLAETFTLTEIQRAYELLMRRTLHKASFRRTLDAAHLVQPTDQWRSEGRGRPARLFRYAPRRRRSARGAVRFEF